MTQTPIFDSASQFKPPKSLETSPKWLKMAQNRQKKRKKSSEIPYEILFYRPTWRFGNASM